MVKQAIIYGGAFNPPTLAHTQILSSCADLARRRGAEVWLMPSGTRSDKTISLTRTDRLLYVDALIADAETRGVTVRVLTLELDRTVLTETYDTVIELQKQYPDYRQTWLFGADSVATMPSWHHGAWLVAHLPMIIIPRIGTDDALLPVPPLAETIRVTTPPVSSTQVRTLMAAGKRIDELVGPRVCELLSAR